MSVSVSMRCVCNACGDTKKLKNTRQFTWDRWFSFSSAFFFVCAFFVTCSILFWFHTLRDFDTGKLVCCTFICRLPYAIHMHTWNESKRHTRQNRWTKEKKVVFPAIYWITFWYSHGTCTACSHTHGSICTILIFDRRAKSPFGVLFLCAVFCHGDGSYSRSHYPVIVVVGRMYTWMLFYEWLAYMCLDDAGSLFWLDWLLVFIRSVRFDLLCAAQRASRFGILFSFLCTQRRLYNKIVYSMRH